MVMQRRLSGATLEESQSMSDEGGGSTGGASEQLWITEFKQMDAGEREAELVAARAWHR
jgi:hypothetical protein